MKVLNQSVREKQNTLLLYEHTPGETRAHEKKKKWSWWARLPPTKPPGSYYTRLRYVQNVVLHTANSDRFFFSMRTLSHSL